MPFIQKQPTAARSGGTTSASASYGTEHSDQCRDSRTERDHVQTATFRLANRVLTSGRCSNSSAVTNSTGTKSAVSCLLDHLLLSTFDCCHVLVFTIYFLFEVSLRLYGANYNYYNILLMMYNKS